MYDKRKIAAVMALCTACMTGCSVLPVEESKTEMSQSDITVADEIAVQENKNENRDKDAYMMNYVMSLSPVLSDEELMQLEIEKKEAQPLQELTDDNIKFCIAYVNEELNGFLSSFPTDEYESLKTTGPLKCIYNGKNSEEINGGIQAKTIGTDAGYWRIADCNYYNSFFYTDGEHNKMKLQFKCTMYHYLLKQSDSLAEMQEEDKLELNTENSEVIVHENAFLSVSMEDISEKLFKTGELEKAVRPEIIMYETYDDFKNGIASPEHSFSKLYISNKFSGHLVNGYIGKPLVEMPALVGNYIDVAQPDNVRQLDEVGISGYIVEWVENDGTMIPYSILSSSVDAGTIIDITQTVTGENAIRIKVAKS